MELKLPPDPLVAAAAPASAPTPTGALAAAGTASAAPAPAAGWATDPTQLTSGTLSSMAGPMQGATTYTPSDNALVANQLNKLLSADSPYITRARTAAAQYANSRGLLNSSMAAGAGEGAAIDAGLPIASADAAAFGRAQSEGAAAQNQFSRDANQFGREGALTVANAGFRSGESALNRQFTADESGKQREFVGTQNAADRTQQTTERMASQEFTTGRDSALFDNRLKEIVATTDSQLKIMDEQNSTNLFQRYSSQTGAINDEYSSKLMDLQAADLDPDVKEGLIQQLQATTIARQESANAVFAATPGWKDEWSKFALDAGG